MKTIFAIILTLFSWPTLAADWAGFYFGPNAGYSASTVSANAYSTDIGGGILGAQGGYNTQFGSMVYGIEGDFQASLQRKSENYLGATLDHKLPWFGTLRGRIGYATGPALIYATGGAAVLSYSAKLSGPGFTLSDDLTRYGWALGAGVEWMLTPKWSAKAEYLRLDTGKQSATLLTVPLDVRATENIIRIGLNYHF